VVELPSIKPGRFRFRKYHVDIVLTLGGAAPALAWGIRGLSSGEITFGVVLLTVGGMLLLGGVIKACFERATEMRSQPPDEPHTLVDWARQLHKQIHQGVSQADLEAINLRITVHKVDRRRWNSSPHSFQQLTNYVGGRQAGLARRFSARPGIIGRVARYGSPLAMSRTSEDDRSFVEEMVLDWCFTWDEAAQISPDRRAWMAVPLTDGKEGPVIGIVYLDAADPDFFTNDVQEVVVGQCELLVERIVERYGRGEGR